MARRIAIGDIMTRNFIFVSPETNLHACAKEMVKTRVNSILVSKKRKLYGIITARDILWAIIKKSNQNIKDIKVTDIATRKVAVVKPSADISQALQKMRQYGFRRLPVLSKNELVGMVTLKDILKVDPSLYSQLGDLADIREEAEKLKKLAKAEEENFAIEGLCEECGALSDLIKLENRGLCPDCYNELY